MIEGSDHRILVLMPTAKDAERTSRILADAGLESVPCRDMHQFCQELEQGAAIGLLTEEAVEADHRGQLGEALKSQPPWSDFPLVILARPTSNGRRIREAMNATLVERPVKVRSLLSVVRSALRLRRHQYEVRDHLGERKRLEMDLREADRKKDDFIALLAHELRNPLAPIRNGLQIMTLAKDDEQAKTSAREMMERQLNHMVRLIDDLLDVSRISRDKMELRRQRVLLEDVISNAIETARPVLDAQGHALHLSLPDRPIYLHADLTRLAQIFSNLLTNSAKYSPRGSDIWLSAERHDAEVEVSVRDAGIGIPTHNLENIFDMFSQVDRSIERSTGGLGIGLALVKALVDAHGGTVSAHSEGHGQGATFTVRLPTLAEGQDGPDAVTPDERTESAGRRVLVVDDNQDGAKSLAMLLTLLGNTVQSASDGVEAIKLADHFRPEVILMDIGMPRLNGYEATRAIREQPWGKDIHIIALTGWGQDHDRELSRRAGCDDHLVKPVNRADLEHKLAQLSATRLS